MGSKRGVRYPSGRFAAWLRAAVDRKIEESEGLGSESAVSRWLGYRERSRLNKWLHRELLPQEDDIPILCRLPGADEDEIREAILWDRLDAFAEDEGIDPARLHRVAARMALASGATKGALQKVLARTDTQELRRAVGSPGRPGDNR